MGEAPTPEARPEKAAKAKPEKEAAASEAKS
jgi:hypothetical protein